MQARHGGPVVALLFALALCAADAAAASEAARRCEAKKLIAAGRHYQCRLHEAGGPAPDLAACDTRLTRAFGAAERHTHGLCPTVGDAAAMQSSNTQHGDGLAVAGFAPKLTRTNEANGRPGAGVPSRRASNVVRAG